MAHPESLPNQKHFSIKHKNLIIVASVVIIAVVILIAPIIPTQHTVTKTRTRNLRYGSQVYGIYNVPKFVNVTNKDTIGGSFTITMNKWYNYPNPLEKTQKLEATSTQSSSIPAGATHAFYLPSDWFIMEPMYSLTYSVSTPSPQESYQETQTEYKSILNLIESLLGA